MNFGRYLVITIFLASSVEQIFSNDDCNDSLRSDLKPLSVTPIDPYPNEMESAGEFLPAGQPLSQTLEDGVYVYLILEDESILYSRRVPLKGATDEAFFATHRSLLQRVKELGLGKISVFGAGEFWVHNGFVAQLSNQAGTLKGGRSSLLFSERVLKKVEIVKEGVELIDESQGKFQPRQGHRLPHENAVLEWELNQSSEGMEYYRDLKRAYSMFYHRFPHPEIPGRIHFSWIGSIYEPIWQGLVRSGKKDLSEQMRVAYSILDVIRSDGLELAVHWGVLGPGFKVSLRESLKYLQIFYGQLVVSQMSETSEEP